MCVEATAPPMRPQGGRARGLAALHVREARPREDVIRPSTLEFPDHVSTVDSGELCDDGNNFSHDGCSPNCVSEVYR